MIRNVRGRSSRRHLAGLVLVLALAGATAAVVSLVAFPHLTINSDESTYLVQADALRHGYLFPPAPSPAPVFQPWLAGVSGGHYVTKYAPVHPGVIALVTRLGAPPLVALVVIAVAAVLALYVLAREVLGDEREALVASAVFTVSPLFILQSATYLPYVSSLALLAGGLAMLLRGARTQRPVALCAGGFLLGMALFARPYDAVLVAGPATLWFLWQFRRSPRPVAYAAAGAALPLLAMVAYFKAATGSFFRLPFQLLDQADTVGFGKRRLSPGSRFVDFGVELGAGSFLSHVHLIVIWCFGGALLVGLAVHALRRHPRPPALVAVALIAITLPAGYAGFWGSATSLSWSAPYHIGPWYWMPVLLPLCVLGGRGLRQVWVRDRVVTAVASALMVLFSTIVVTSAMADALDTADADRHVWSAVGRADLRQAMVFLPGPGLGNPLQEATNSATFDDEVLWALQRSDCDDEAVARAHGRRPYRLDLPPWYRGLSGAALDRLEPVPIRCLPWMRRADGEADAVLHGDAARPAAIVTPGINVPNPAVLVDGGRYYLFSTQDTFTGANVPVRIGERRDGYGAPVDALPELPAWAVRGFTWAPDVRRVGDRFVMWFTAGTREPRPDGQAFVECIGVAVASRPEGPYRATSDEPVICQRRRHGSIDPRTFVDADGAMWLHWKSDDNADVHGSSRSTIFGQRLADDGITLRGRPRRLLEADQWWEGRIVESPQLVQSGSRYWLFYSGNWFNRADYAIGVASCDGPLGPCQKPSRQPWLASNGQGDGPGEGSLFHDAEGWWLAYSPNHVRPGVGSKRPVALAALRFGHDGPILTDRR